MERCPRCGSTNPAEARYCMTCGAALTDRATIAEGVRKTVTVVFADVTGFTSLGDRLDAESLRLVMGAYFERMQAILERHGGTVEKFVGDAVMAVFGVPVLHEDDASRAVRAALEMHASLGELNDDLRAQRGVSLRASVGVNTGEVVTADSRSGHSLATGGAVILAARLEQAAAPGQVLIGPETYRLVRDEVEAEPVEIELKGKQDRVKAYRLVSVSERPHAFAIRFDSPLIARDEELDILFRTYKRVVESKDCVLATVMGPAGIGKSRLMKEFLNVVQLEATTLWGRCLPYGEGITLWPLTEIVRQAAGVTEGDSTTAAEAKVVGLLEGDDDGPLICERVMGATGIGGTIHGTEEIFWAVRKLLQALASTRPVVVVFDDIHWAKPVFLDLVEYVSWSGKNAPILLVCLARPELLELRSSWGQASRDAVSLTLERLPVEESERLVGNLLRGADVPGAMRRHISRAGGGNPLFVEEMVRMWIDEGFVEQSDGSWRILRAPSDMVAPPTIQALLSARLDALPQAERAVAQRAAVVGQTFWWGAVSELSPHEVRGEVGGHLNSLVRQGFVEPCRSSFAEEDAFRFRHILMRDCAYQAVPKEAKARLHERFAGWLTRKTLERVGEYEEIIGFHLEQAFRFRAELGPPTQGALDLAEAAAERLVSSGRRAHASGDMSAAVNLFERTVALFGLDDRRCLAFAPDLAAALVEMGQFGRAEEVLTVTEAAARREGDKAAQYSARLELIRLNLFSHAAGTLDEARRQTMTAVADCQELGDDDVLAKAWNLSGFIDLASGRAALAREAWQRAIVHARVAERRQEEFDSLYWLAIALELGPTPAGVAVDECEEILRMAADHQRVVASTLASQGALQAMRGEIETARTLAARAHAIYDDLGASVPAATSAMSFGFIETLAGDLVEAEHQLRMGYDMLKRMDERGFLSTVAAQLADVLCAQARFDEANDLIDMSADLAAADDVTSQAMWRTARAKVLMQVGSLGEAETFAREALRGIERTDFLNVHANTLMQLAAVLGEQGREEEAGVAEARAIELFERKGNVVLAGAARTERAKSEGGARGGRTAADQPPGSGRSEARASP